MKSVRKLIVEFIQKNHAASAAELSDSLQVTRADIRYHLKELLNEKTIEIAPGGEIMRRGRPAHLYRIAPGAQADNYLQIADILLSIASGSTNIPEDKIEILAHEILSQMPQAKQQIRKLNQLIRYLNEHGYRAGWEAYRSGPRIHFRNCPYAAIIQRHPELCKMDRIILEKSLQTGFEQVQKIDRQSGQFTTCIFIAANGKTGK